MPVDSDEMLRAALACLQAAEQVDDVRGRDLLLRCADLMMSTSEWIDQRAGDREEWACEDGRSRLH
jgi:hypothetical protein